MNYFESENPYETPIENVLFLNYTYLKYGRGIDACEFPIYVCTPEVSSNPGSIEILIKPISFEVKADIITNFTIEENLVLLTIIKEGHEDQVIAIPYIAMRFELEPSILYVCLLYPWDAFLNHYRKYESIPSFTLSFYSDTEIEGTPPTSLSVEGGDSWLDIYKGLEDNTKKLHLEELRVILNNYGYEHIAKYFVERD